MYHTAYKVAYAVAGCIVLGGEGAVAGGFIVGAVTGGAGAEAGAVVGGAVGCGIGGYIGWKYQIIYP